MRDREHVNLQPDGIWSFMNDSEPNVDNSRLDGHFIPLQKLYDDYGLAQIIKILSSIEARF